MIGAAIMANKKKPKPKIDKEDFIDFLVRATPQEVNDLILNRGKSCKYYYPIYIFRNIDQQKSHNGGN